MLSALCDFRQWTIDNRLRTPVSPDYARKGFPYCWLLGIMMRLTVFKQSAAAALKAHGFIGHFSFQICHCTFDIGK